MSDAPTPAAEAVAADPSTITLDELSLKADGEVCCFFAFHAV